MRTATVSARLLPTLTVIQGGAAADNPLASISEMLPGIRSEFTEGGELLKEEGGERVSNAQLIAIALVREGIEITGAVLDAVNAESRGKIDRLGQLKFVIAGSWLHGLEGSCVSDRIRISRSWGRGFIDYDPSSKSSLETMARMLQHHMRRLRNDQGAWMTIELVINE